jgi:hypothetical protein
MVSLPSLAIMKWLVAGVVVGSLAVGLAWILRGEISEDGRVIDAGPLDAFHTAGAFPPILYARDAFYLVKTPSGEPRALYAYPQPAQREGRSGCAVVWMPAREVGSENGVFRDPCFGTTFALDGSWLGGPSERGLDHFDVELSGDRIRVDTRRLLCDGPGVCKRVE